MLALRSSVRGDRSSVIVAVVGRSMLPMPFIIMLTLCILNRVLMDYWSMLLLVEAVLAPQMIRLVALRTLHLMHGYWAMFLCEMVGRPMSTMMILAKVLRASLVGGMLLS